MENYGQFDQNNSPFGFEAVEIVGRIVQKDSVFRLIFDVLERAYSTLLGEPGADFVKYCFRQLQKLPSEPSLSEIQSVFLNTRSRFSSLNLHRPYFESFRHADLLRSIDLSGKESLSGDVIDVGSGDNAFGAMLIEQGIASRVVGVEVQKPAGVHVHYGPNLKYVILKDVEIPTISRICQFFGGNKPNAIINRYSLHHMTVRQQRRILNAERQILGADSLLIVFEDTYSFQKSPEIENNIPEFHRRMLNLGDENAIRLFLSGLDISGHFWRDKNQLFPWTYRSIEEWTREFQNLGFHVQTVRYAGIGIIPPAPNGVFLLKSAESCS